MQWILSQSDDAARLSGYHPQASGLDYTHVNPASHQAIATPDSTTSNTKHSASWQDALFGSVRKCIDQLPSAKVRRPRQDYVKDEVKANKHKVCYTLAVGFIWNLPGPVDAKINMACAGLSVGTVTLSALQKASLYGCMAEHLETQVLRQQGSQLVCTNGVYAALTAPYI
jgi:hypothetical protein